MSSVLPLKALLVFDAVMKRNSFSKAAADLYVTPGAVGQQIQNLEEWLGLTLFVRMVRQIEPTEQARAYWAEVQPALAQLQQASNDIRESQRSDVRLSMPPTFAAKWFAPRMAKFVSLHPKLSLHLSASKDLIDFGRDRANMAIRYFDGIDSTLATALLIPDEARLYCSPAYARKNSLSDRKSLSGITLLHTTLHPHWHEWLRTFSGFDDPQIDGMPGQHFDQAILAIEAAKNGQGALLCSACLTQLEVREGSLCEPFDVKLLLSKGYYLVHHRQTVLRPAVSALKNWLIEAAKE